MGNNTEIKDLNLTLPSQEEKGLGWRI